MCTNPIYTFLFYVFGMGKYTLKSNFNQNELKLFPRKNKLKTCKEWHYPSLLHVSQPSARINFKHYISSWRQHKKIKYIPKHKLPLIAGNCLHAYFCLKREAQHHTEEFNSIPFERSVIGLSNIQKMQKKKLVIENEFTKQKNKLLSTPWFEFECFICSAQCNW